MERWQSGLIRAVLESQMAKGPNRRGKTRSVFDGFHLEKRRKRRLLWRDGRAV